MNLETLSLSSAQDFITNTLSRAGVTVNGPLASDIKIHNTKFYNRVLAQGSLGLGESYMEGWWDCEDLSQFFYLLLRARLDETVNPATLALQSLKSKVLTLGRNDPYKIGQFHYDIGDDLYQRMLDKRMIYTCGYWRDAQNLDEAQENKLQLICDKLYLEPGMRVLDIGCGWGGFLKYAAQNYGIKGVGITVSNEQAIKARENCRGLDIEIRLEDYRETIGQFDRIASIGMFEHVGKKNYQTFFKKAAECLTDDGLFLLHAIGNSETSGGGTDPWIEKYIFPNSMIPSISHVATSIEGLFVMEDWHNFGPHYDKTLLSWFENFDYSWPQLQEKFDETFYRKWKYYLLSCAGTFRARRTQLWQIVLTKHGLVNGYTSLR